MEEEIHTVEQYHLLHLYASACFHSDQYLYTYGGNQSALQGSLHQMDSTATSTCPFAPGLELQQAKNVFE